jgi:rhodanese-related sulfurtransferase
MIRIPPARFLLFDSGGLLLWSGAYVLAGYIFSRQIELVVERLSNFGGSLLVVTAVSASVYLVLKYSQRRRFLNSLESSRISADELKGKMDSGEPVTVLDLRNQLDLNIERVRIPGAFHMLPDFVVVSPDELLKTGEVVLYCSCPNEATSAKVAGLLRRSGWPQVRPLEGGLSAWLERGYPVDSLD